MALEESGFPLFLALPSPNLQVFISVHVTGQWLLMLEMPSALVSWKSLFRVIVPFADPELPEEERTMVLDSEFNPRFGCSKHQHMHVCRLPN